MICPHCWTEVEIAEFMTNCPLCKKDIKTEVNHQLAAEGCLRDSITPAAREKIEMLLLEDRRAEAMHLVRRLRGKTEAFVEARVLRMIEQTSTNEQLLNHIAEINSNRANQDRGHIFLASCSACNKQISTKAESCPHCGHPTGVHVCPKCNSTNTKVISGSSKATSIFLWGPFAANNVLSKFQCKDCGHKW